MTGDDGRYPDGSAVEARYPLTPGQAPDAWAWVNGTVLERCGPDEWRVRVDARELATLDDGSQPPAGTPDAGLMFPVCYRAASELRPAPVSAFRCPCCGDDVFGTPPVCQGCRADGCQQGTDTAGDVDWWRCQRPDGGEAE